MKSLFLLPIAGVFNILGSVALATTTNVVATTNGSQNIAILFGLLFLIFISGFVSGFYFYSFIQKVTQKNEDVNSVLSAINRKETLQVITGLVIVMIWVVSVILSMIDKNFTVNALTHTFMGTIVGFLYGPNLLNNKK